MTLRILFLFLCVGGCLFVDSFWVVPFGWCLFGGAVLVVPFAGAFLVVP
jgi:hypothetical protein